MGVRSAVLGIACAAAVGDLLDAARIEAGELSLEPTATDAAAIAREAAALYADATAKHTIDVDVPDPAPTIRDDPLRPGQVLTNLVGTP